MVHVGKNNPYTEHLGYVYLNSFIHWCLWWVSTFDPVPRGFPNPQDCLHFKKSFALLWEQALFGLGEFFQFSEFFLDKNRVAKSKGCCSICWIYLRTQDAGSSPPGLVHVLVLVGNPNLNHLFMTGTGKWASFWILSENTGFVWLHVPPAIGRSSWGFSCILVGGYLRTIEMDSHFRNTPLQNKRLGPPKK